MPPVGLGAAILFAGALACGLVANAEETADFHKPEAVTKIAFGSCFDPRDKVDTAFDGVLAQKPDVFVFLGDNIYGDTADMDVLRKKYAELEAVDGFRKVRETSTLLATWDDHDYGINDGGKSYSKRKESQQIFLDFFKDPADSPRRKREGVYASYTFGPVGKRCQILLLDTRYFRDEIPRSKEKRKPRTVGWYRPVDDPSLTLLGETQWAWLERQLKVPADVRIIASSIQVLAVEKGMENWGNVPHEQRRLFELLRKHRADHTVAISGDVHFAELSKTQIGSYPFYDMTSSGLSHTNRGWASADNSLRVGKSHFQRNAGLVEIDWEGKKLELAAVGEDGQKLFSHSVPFLELRFP
ncbi:hypothetical protein HAHE_06730 [Haloferula helveola]|uniref:PhoD-like phosphatase metallophosphatase domain-containing protein n=2 Tax=Haloferula helveola TaxID=490095 RepID=A0ABN6GZR4_9BACT|nr:hypothetical protein HAHE_06730 [Haloferula helveola]